MYGLRGLLLDLETSSEIVAPWHDDGVATLGTLSYCVSIVGKMRKKSSYHFFKETFVDLTFFAI